MPQLEAIASLPGGSGPFNLSSHPSRQPVSMPLDDIPVPRLPLSSSILYSSIATFNRWVTAPIVFDTLATNRNASVELRDASLPV